MRVPQVCLLSSLLFSVTIDWVLKKATGAKSIVWNEDRHFSDLDYTYDAHERHPGASKLCGRNNRHHLVGIFSPMYGSCLNTSMILARKASMLSLLVLTLSSSCSWYIVSPMYGSCLFIFMILATKASMPSLLVLTLSSSCPWEKIH